MALTIGIVGPPSVGKSTLLNALTRTTVLAANYPFAATEPNVGAVPLPDTRLDRLAELFHSTRVVPATISFVDIAGIVHGASEGEGLGDQFLVNIREADVVCMVTRVFEDPDVVHADGKVESVGDTGTISTELVPADTQTLEKVIPRLEKEVRGRKTEPAVLETVQAALKVLEEGTPLSAGAEAAGISAEVLKTFQPMAAKPFIYVFNMDDAGTSDEVRQAKLRELMVPAEAISLDAQLEAEPVELEPEEVAEMLYDNRQKESGLDKLARVGSDTLGLQTYLTAGEKGPCAWTIRKGATVPQAAGVIHAGFGRGLIKAEIMSYDDLVQYGSVAEACAHGRVCMEGRDHAMVDRDVVEFRSDM